MKTVFYRPLALLAFGMLVLTIGNVMASDISLSKSVDGIDIYMGIAHIQKAGQDTTAHELSMMKSLRGKKHHVTVALFDSKSGQRITDARVVAGIGEVGLISNRKRLKPQQFGDAVSYGRNFYISKEGSHWIDLKIKREGIKQATMARFEWKHF